MVKFIEALVFISDISSYKPMIFNMDKIVKVTTWKFEERKNCLEILSDSEQNHLRFDLGMKFNSGDGCMLFYEEDGHIEKYYVLNEYVTIKHELLRSTK